MVIALVSSVLLVVLVCTLTVIALYCHARRRNKRRRGTSSWSQSTTTSASDFSLPRIPRANVVAQSETHTAVAAARLPQRSARVWRAGNPPLSFCRYFTRCLLGLQCFDAVGLAAERASGL